MAKKKTSKKSKGVQRISKIFPRNSKLTGWEILKWFTILLLMVIVTGLVYLFIEWKVSGDLNLAIQTGMKEALAVMLYTFIFGLLFWVLFRERAD